MLLFLVDRILLMLFLAYIAEIGKFLHQVVVQRTNVAVSSWRKWLLEDPLVRPYRWLRSDTVLPSPFLRCDPAVTPDVSFFIKTQR